MPPNAFSNELEKWVFQKYIGSIVFVEFRKNSYDELKKLWNKVLPITGSGTEKKNAERVREADLRADALCSTGFVVKAEENHLLILTCAHVLEASFSKDKPITAAKVEDYFSVHIICDHREGKHISGIETDVKRQYVRASVRQISCGMDMILLSIPNHALKNYCPEDHPVIPMAPSYPESLEEVVMLSWPPLRHRTAVSGETSHELRDNSSVSCANPQGFICRFAEVNITSENGSSGAPLINGAGEFLCILHGGYGSGFSFFVSFEDVRNTLLHWGKYKIS